MKKSFALIFILFCLIPVSSQELKASLNIPEDSVMMTLVKNWAEEVGALAGVTFQIESMSFRRSEFSDIQMLETPVFKLPLYLVFNSRFRELVPAVSAAMKELSDSGRTAEIFNPE